MGLRRDAAPLVLTVDGASAMRTRTLQASCPARGECGLDSFRQRLELRRHGKRFLFFYSRIGSAVVVATPAGVLRTERRRRCRSWRDGPCYGVTTASGLCAGHLIDDIGARLRVIAPTANARPSTALEQAPVASRSIA